MVRRVRPGNGRCRNRCCYQRIHSYESGNFQPRTGSPHRSRKHLRSDRSDNSHRARIRNRSPEYVRVTHRRSRVA
jgi:hypothetical protein